MSTTISRILLIVMSAAGLFGGPLGGAQETPKDAPPAPRAKRTTQVVTAPIAAVTVPAGTFISIIVDQGLTLDSPPGTPFEGHTETAFHLRGRPLKVTLRRPSRYGILPSHQPECRSGGSPVVSARAGVISQME